MKLIALRDFRNTQNLDLDGDGKFDKVHESHVQKGAVFSIGGNKDFKDLTKAQQAIVFQLNAARCVGDASDEKTVARIEAEVKAEKAAEEKARKTALAAGGNEHLVKVIVETLAGLGLLKPEKAKPAGA